MLQMNQPHETKVMNFGEMQNFSEEWDQLCNRALESNVYYSPNYTAALLNSPDGNPEAVSFITSWRSGRMTGLLPVTRNRFAVSGMMPKGKTWITPYTYNGIPLLDQCDPTNVASALLGHLEKMGGGDWMLNDIYTDGQVFEAIKRAFEMRGLKWQTVRSYQRASMYNSYDFDQLLNEHVPAKRRKDLRRNRRRLEDLGKVSHEVHVDGEGLERAREAFLGLEAEGWKGARGTALACSESSLMFARNAFVTAGSARTRIDLLLLDGKPIAAGVIVFSGDTAFTIKGAYDEEYRTYSAGLLLELEVANSFLSEKWAFRLDSATAGEHVIDFLWPDRREVSDVVFNCSPKASERSLKRYRTASAVYKKARSTAKRILNRK